MSNLHRNPLNLFGQAFWCLWRGFTFDSERDSIPGLHLQTIHTNEYPSGTLMYVENVYWNISNGWTKHQLPPFGEWAFDDDPPVGWRGERLPSGIGRAYCLQDSADADYRAFLAIFERFAEVADGARLIQGNGVEYFQSDIYRSMDMVPPDSGDDTDYWRLTSEDDFDPEDVASTCVLEMMAALECSRRNEPTPLALIVDHLAESVLEETLEELADDLEPGQTIADAAAEYRSTGNPGLQAGARAVAAVCGRPMERARDSFP